MHEDVIDSEMWDQETTWERWRPYVRRFFKGFGISMVIMALLPVLCLVAKAVFEVLLFIAGEIYELGGPYLYLGALALLIATVVGIVVAIYGKEW